MLCGKALGCVLRGVLSSSAKATWLHASAMSDRVVVTKAAAECQQPTGDPRRWWESWLKLASPRSERA